jgi:leucyl-tRNA synthetase
MEYNFQEIEKNAREKWTDEDIYRVKNDSPNPKCYVLDMFPYPSGAGLHVGHPLGYIATDIYSRFKRLKGFNVLHPMGWDAFGLPAEQYAIQTGQHPAITTEQNIARYRSQMDMLGLSYDWSREVKTSDPAFYKWTQWIFLKLFKSWYNNKSKKAEPIENLINQFEQSGTSNVNAACGEEMNFTSDEWKNYSEKKKSEVLFNYRLAYLSEAMVNWCLALGTVLANDEVKDGVSERGGYPVERKLMPQWSLRMTAYADRLLDDLNTLDWSDSIKEAQRNWIGRSEGCSLQFTIDNSQLTITVFTTRPDTVFGATFITLAPENELVDKITAPSHKAKVDEYVKIAKNRTERERQAEKKVSGEFSGAYAIHPFTGNKMPIWVGDYVLAGYGTGAVMGVPAHDSRDFAFAKHFGLEIKQVIEPSLAISHQPSAINQQESYDGKEGKCINSDFLNGLEVKDAIKHAIEEIEKRGLGKGKVNFRLRDAAFGRQRYWGEPIPIYYKDGIPTAMDESELPLILPEIDKYQPTETGEPPLARAKDWKYKGKYNYEYTTMPGWAGSSWYYLRYEDPNNPNAFASPEAIKYWQNVDLYVGGAEHSTGHLIYFRFWTKFLYDLGLVPFVEPAKKLVNQGMIQGLSEKIHLRTVHSTNTSFYSKELGKIENTHYISNEPVQIFDSADLYNIIVANSNPFYRTVINVPIELVKDNILDVSAFIKVRPEYKNAAFLINGTYWRDDKIYDRHNDKFYECTDKTQIAFKTLNEVEKMSKSKYNVVNPDDVISEYGADTLRMYEMFLGPLELSKPWSTQGISGVYSFLKRFWRLFFNEKDEFTVVGAIHESPLPAELKVLHKTIKKIEEDIERLSFNTAVSAFMICLNELYELKCNKRAILEPLVISLSPFAPFIAEELWSKLGHTSSVLKATYPKFEEAYLKENTFTYPVSFNGRTRFMLELPLNLSKAEIEKEALSSEDAKKWLKDATVKKVIVVPNKIVNIVI